jgi:hypothetical protein
MINKQGVSLTFYAHYVDADGVSVTGLTVTVDVYEGTTASPIVTAASATELANGLYYYTLSSGSVDADGAYIAMFETADTDVAQRHLPALQSVGNIIKSDVQTIVSGAITAAAIATDAIDADALASDAIAEINATVDTAIADAALATAANLATAAGYIDTEVAAIKLKTDLIPTDPAETSDIPSANTIADAVLSRGVSNVQDTADTTSLAALILATFESSISGTTWTIRKTGGSSFVVKTVTVDAGAEPIVGVT